jgi:hypothetical protein
LILIKFKGRRRRHPRGKVGEKEATADLILGAVNNHVVVPTERALEQEVGSRGARGLPGVGPLFDVTTPGLAAGWSKETDLRAVRRTRTAGHDRGDLLAKEQAF